jgi:uncharacterized protein YpiB (UPF0302 family)
MYRLGRNKLLEAHTSHVCPQCAYRFQFEQQGHPKEFLDVVRQLASLHEKGTVSEEVYKELLRAIISGYIQGVIENKVTQKLDEALCDKLSPKNFFEALV